MRYKDKDGNWKELSIKASDTLPIGAIIPFGGTEAPTNWLICDGSMLNRAAYPELFKAIGTSFGTDGPNNFYIPDLRGRVIVGQDTSDADFGIGLTGGEKTHTLNVSEMPSHTHNNQMAVFYDIDKNYGLTQGTLYSDRIIGRYDGETNYVAGVQNIKNTGGNQPHNNLQPYTVTNYIIKAKQSVGVVGNVVNEKTTSDKDTYSCDYINDKNKWKFAGSSTGNSDKNATIIIPDEWNEAEIYVRFPDMGDGFYAIGRVSKIAMELLPVNADDSVSFGLTPYTRAGQQADASVTAVNIAYYQNTSSFEIVYTPNQTATSSLYVYYR